MLKLIDSHAHLNDERLLSQLEDVMDSSSELKYIFTCAYDLPSIYKSVELSEKYEKIYAIIGIHPHDALCYTSDIEKKLLEFGRHKKVIAIGEIGLDYHYVSNNDDFEEIKKRQVEVFVAQLKIAHELSLPIVIHLRDAKEDLYKLLLENKNLLTFGGVVHCFSEDVDFMKRIIDLGLMVSFTGVITFKNAGVVGDVVKNVPLDKFLLETDSPYLTPEPLRGQKTNEPKYVKMVAQKFAALKGMLVEEVVDRSYQNAIKLFSKIKSD